MVGFLGTSKGESRGLGLTKTVELLGEDSESGFGGFRWPDVAEGGGDW